MRGAAQQHLVEDLLDNARREHPEIETYFSDAVEEPVFVKNLENVQGDDSGATLCMEWYDANQTYLGGSYPSGAKGTTAGWKRVHGVSGRVPERAARGTVTCYVRRGMTGTAWFDDVAVRRYYPPLITGMTADRHRATYAGEPAEIIVGLESEVASGPGTDLALDAVLLADTDAPVAPIAIRPPQPDLAVLRVDTAPLAPRKVRATKSAMLPNG